MDESQNNDQNFVPQPAAPYGNVPHDAASYRNMPQAAAPYRTLPHDAVTEENDDLEYTLTTKEAANRCVDAGLPRIERTMLNWCQPDRNGQSRMQCHYDHASRKWFINEESFEVALAEEISRAKSRGEFVGQKVEGASLPHAAEKHAEEVRHQPEPTESRPTQTANGEREFRDIAIASGVKDLRIKDLERQIEKLEETVEQEKTEKREYIERLIKITGRAGQLEGVISGPTLLEARKPEADTPMEIDERDLKNESQPEQRPSRVLPEQGDDLQSADSANSTEQHDQAEHAEGQQNPNPHQPW